MCADMWAGCSQPHFFSCSCPPSPSHAHPPPFLPCACAWSSPAARGVGRCRQSARVASGRHVAAALAAQAVGAWQRNPRAPRGRHGGHASAAGVGCRCSVWGVVYGVWGTECEVWGVRDVGYGVWGTECEVWGVRDVGYGVWGTACGRRKQMRKSPSKGLRFACGEHTVVRTG
eukprot:360195-Chlamydomonas_euryale.AAC.4